MALKYLLPALSVASTAYAACSADGTTTVRNPSDISTCSTFSGNIAVATGAANGGTTDFGDLEKIDGDFTYEGDSSVQTVKFGSLKEVTGDFTYSNLSSLSASGLGSLKSIGGALLIEGVGLSDLGLDAGLEEVGTVTIINTGIQSLQGVANVSKIDGLTISDNLNLAEISLDVSEIGMINVGSGQQANGGQSASFRNLENAKSVVVRNCSAVDFASLANVTNDFRLIGNTFETFAAKNLSTVGALVINSNGDLKNFSFPVLEQIRSKNATLQIANNTKLNTIDGFPELNIVTGDVDFYGNFSELKVENISRIDGALKVATASDTFDCDAVKDINSNHVVKGDVKCKKSDKSRLAGSGSETGTSTGDEAAASSSGFASPLEIPAEFMSGFALIASLLSMFM